MSLDTFLSGLPFSPDQFQVEAARALEAGKKAVIVTAPTGAGKTLVAEAAVHLALEEGRRAVYTTPIKALSNQKYGDFVAQLGTSRVGLLTGDNVINGEAEVVVMTTEVLRNMIYARSGYLADVGVAVLDEVHYLQDRMRGAVWEEVIIHAPAHVQLVCLSATIANAAEFADWVGERRGPVDLIVERRRPVPLESKYLVKDRFGGELRLYDTFASRDGRLRANPKVEHLLSLERGRRRRFAVPGRLETIELMAAQGMLPAIYFIFSRAGCDAAALRCLEAGIRLTHPDEREAIRRIAEEKTAHLADTDLAVLDFPRWLAGLEAGIAPHHAGLVPAFKETAEDLFARGLLKLVFATETLALGINMPARSVVLESLSKFDGEGHDLLQPGDYTQLTGRAGRRGIDTVGYGLVLHSPFVRFGRVAEIAAAGDHPLRSSFRPTYNMSANLLANYSEERASELLAASYAQYQRQGDHAAAQAELVALEDRLAGELDRARCELGSIDDYVEQGAAPRPGRSDLAGRLAPGDVVDIAGGARQGRYLVLSRLSREGGARLLALGTSGRTVTISARDVTSGSVKAGVIELPLPYRPRDRRFQQSALRLLRKIPPAPRARPATAAAPSAPAHPVAACPDLEAHLRARRRAERTAQRIELLRSNLRRSGVGLVEEFHAILRLLGGLGYVDGWTLAPAGERLRFIYNELDLLLAETVERGILSDLDPSELAALCSCFVYEPRAEEGSNPPWPTPDLAVAWKEIEDLAAELNDRERGERLSPTRKPEPGFAALAWAWAEGSSLEDLPNMKLQPGDFVRVSRQLVDLLRQLRDAAPDMSASAREGLLRIDRGVVAATGFA